MDQKQTDQKIDKSTLKRLFPAKLNEDGTYKQFHGSTIISFITPTVHPEWFQACCATQEIIKKSKIGSFFAMLPTSSFHITIFDLICDSVRMRNKWPSDMGFKVPFSECEAEMIKRTKPLLAKQKKTPSKFEFKFSGVKVCSPSILVTCLTPGIADFRQEAASLTKLPYGDKRFHLSLAYQTHELPPSLEKEVPAIEREILNLWQNVTMKTPTVVPLPPTLTFFRDMTSYPTNPIYPENNKLLPNEDPMEICSNETAPNMVNTNNAAVLSAVQSLQLFVEEQFKRVNERLDRVEETLKLSKQ
jgi:hypothetical protein